MLGATACRNGISTLSCCPIVPRRTHSSREKRARQRQFRERLGKDAGFWKHSHTRQAWWDEVSAQLGVVSLDQWYGFQLKDLKPYGGRWLSNVYKGRGWTYGLVVQYPKHKWEPWRFNPVASYVWDDIQNRRGLLDAYMKDLNMTRMEDWYDVNMEKIDHSLHGTRLLARYGASLYKTLKDTYTEHTWRPWLFKRTEDGFWDNPQHLRDWFEWLAPKLQVKEPHDWLNYTRDQVVEAAGMAPGFTNTLLALSIAYPHLEWSLLRTVPPLNPSNYANVREYFDLFAAKMSIKGPEDWYNLSVKAIADTEQTFVEFLNERFQGNLHTALSQIYPEHLWYPWLLAEQPANTWDSVTTQMDYFKWLARKLDIDQGLRTWYTQDPKVIRENRGESLLKLYKDRMPTALMNIFPDHKWHPWLFKTGTMVSIGYWDDPKNQREYLDWLGGHLGVRELEDWYQIKVSDVAKNGGVSLLSRHGDSLIKLLSAIYNDHMWYPWLFRQLPAGYWENAENRKYYVEWLGKQLQIQDVSNWYEVLEEDIYRNGGVSLLKKFRTVSNILADVYPTHTWDQWSQARKHRRSKHKFDAINP